MPLQDNMHLISVDDHVIEHPRVWTDRLPAGYQEVAPQIVEVARVDLEERQHADASATNNGAPDIAEVWKFEGKLIPTIALNAVAGRPLEEYGLEPYRYDQLLPGCYDPQARLRDMDADKIHSQLCFPSFPGFAGKIFYRAQDKELGKLCIAAWNDFMIDEWKGAAPHRFIAPVMLPVWDVEAAVAEIERTAAKGAQTITFPENPYPLGLPSFHSDYWDPIFAAAADAELPLSLHFGTSTVTPSTAPDAPFMTSIALFGTNSMYAMADLVYSPVFHKHPNLKVALAEGGIGWFPYLLDRMDFVWERHRYYQNVNQTMAPSEIVRRNIWGCFIDDPTGISLREKIGVDKVMWELDYPHSDSNWPNAHKILSEQMRDVPDEDVHKMVELNARALFRHERRDA